MAFGKQGLVARHWRGEYSLARSFWLHYLFGFIVILSMMALVQAVVGVLGSMIILVGAFVWGIVGAWRSSKKVPAATGGKLVRIFFIAQLVVVTGVFGLAFMYLVLSAMSGPPH